ncbi:MAG TPA: BamA/TamA family outer membrane protein [Labilithrix sp.]|nr:BamA/TamA family outer membrane protein [Labilithrix sp.]
MLALVACFGASTAHAQPASVPETAPPAAEPEAAPPEQRGVAPAPEAPPGESGKPEARTGEPPREERAKPQPAPGSGSTTPKRAVPDYDGRGSPPTTAGDVLLWVPRVLFAPLYFVSEYLVRRPLGLLITTAERNQWPSAIRNFFLFGPEKKAGIVPTAFLDFGLRASVGIYAFWDDLFVPGNHLRLHASTLGTDWLQGALADKIPLGKDTTVDLRVEGVHRPDNIFHGLGPRSLQNQRTRYGIDQFRARPVFERTWWKSSRIATEAGFKYVAFRDDACCDDPSLVIAIRDGWQQSPPGFANGYSSVYQRGELTVDTRDERPRNQSGVRLELEAEHGSNVRRSSGSWIRYGGTVGGILDIKNNRTVSLSVTTLFVDPASRGAEIPFTEQIVLGGSGPMRGYLYGRLIDRSAAIATLKYKWPIWVFLDGTAQISTGNVFGPHLGDFTTKLLRLSGAIGVESIGSPDHTFELLAGFGTETFERNLEVNSFRLLFGTNRGF